MIRRPPRSTQSRSSAASDVYKRQALSQAYKGKITFNGMGKSYVSVKISPKVKPFDMMKDTVEIVYQNRAKENKNTNSQ